MIESWAIAVGSNSVLYPTPQAQRHPSRCRCWFWLPGMFPGTPYSLISSRHEVRRLIDAPGGKVGSWMDTPPPARPESATSLPDAVISRMGLEAS